MPTVAEPVVKLRARTQQFERSMRRAGSRTRMVSGDLGKLKVAAASVATAMTAAGAAIAVMGGRSIRAASELNRLTALAGATAEEFQFLAAGARTVGFSNEKLADVLKDVNDKVGDFLATGGGQLKDFFEQVAPLVGVTAEQFRNLSSADALGLYVRSLEEANLSQAQMTFYLEAIANDATALLPILRRNGEALNQFGEAARNSGEFISADALRRAHDLTIALESAANVVQNRFVQGFLDASGTSATLNANVERLIQLAGDAADAIGRGIGEAVSVVGRYSDIIKDVAERVVALGAILRSTHSIFANVLLGAAGALAQGIGTAIGFLETSFAAAATKIRQGMAAVLGAIINSINAVGARISELTAGQISFSPIETPAPVAPVEATTLGESLRGLGAALGAGSGDRIVEEAEAIRDNVSRIFAALPETPTIPSIAQEPGSLDFLEGSDESFKEFNERRLEAAFNAYAMEQDAAQQNQDALARIEGLGLQYRLSQYRSSLSDVLTFISTTGRKGFNLVKNLRIGEAVIDGYAAATAAWRHGMAQGGPPLAAAYTAGSLARTGTLINGIRGASASGGGSFSAGGGGAPRAPLQVQVSGLSAGQLVDGADIGNLLERLTAEAGDRGLQLLVRP